MRKTGCSLTLSVNLLMVLATRRAMRQTSRQAWWWEEVWKRRKGCWGLERPHEGSGESLMSAGPLPRLLGSSGGLPAWAKCPPHTWLAPSSRARTMGSKPWEFPQDLGVNSGSSTYSCMTLGTVLKAPLLQMRVIIMGDQTRDIRGEVSRTIQGSESMLKK